MLALKSNPYRAVGALAVARQAVHRVVGERIVQGLARGVGHLIVAPDRPSPAGS